MSTTQISTHVSSTVKDDLDRFARERGMKKGFVIEQALLHHLQALRELPQEVIVPPRLVLDGEDFERLAERIATPPEPTAALAELMNDD